MKYLILITKDFICIILFNLQLHEVNHMIIPIVQILKWRLNECKKLAPNHTTNEW